MADHLRAIKEAVIEGKHKDIENLVRSAIESHADLQGIINEAMIPAMDAIGQRFADKQIFVPEMLVSAHTMKIGLDIIKGHLKGENTASKGKIVICTVKGDIHDIGKNLVVMMLEGAGFEVVNLGVDMSVEKVIETVQEVKPAVLGLSALLTTTMLEMKKVIDSLKAGGLRNSVKVMVGGAPVDRTFAEKIGADGYGEDATEAVRLARELISGN